MSNVRRDPNFPHKRMRGITPIVFEPDKGILHRGYIKTLRIRFVRAAEVIAMRVKDDRGKHPVCPRYRIHVRAGFESQGSFLQKETDNPSVRPFRSRWYRE